MKNLFKVLGIVLMLAVVGLAVSCGPADPDDQVLITVTGIHSSFDGKYAVAALAKAKDADTMVAYSTVGKRISGGSVTCEMEDEKGAYGKEDNLYVFLFISDSATDLENSIYEGVTTAQKSITKGENTIPASGFFPDSIVIGITSAPAPIERIAAFRGTYKVSYRSAASINTANIVETIDLTDVNKFVISDANVATSNTVVDKLEFRIDEWDYATTPGAYAATYPNAFMFKGKILSSTGGYYGTTSQTGKGIVIGDIKADGSGPDCWMYLYFSGDGKVIRTPFTKSGATENTDVVRFWADAASPLREYTKQ